MKQLFIFILLIFFSVFAHATDIVNVYNWSGYLPDSVIKKFEKETGIKVNYATYDSNETLYAKLKATPNAGYDVIVPSTYYLDRMRQEHMLQKIDKTQIPNFKYLTPRFLNQSYDPHNDYSIPYFWGTTAITVNTRYHAQAPITSWHHFWDPNYKNTLMLLDDMREVFSMALISLGYSPNETDETHIYQAYLKLKSLLPNVKLFNADAEEAIYIDEDATLGMGWSGDIYLAKQENPALNYIYPQEGFIIWIDNLAIPTGAKHLKNAHVFINFILRPDVAKTISLQTGYASANQGAITLLPAHIRNNPIMYPDAKTLSHGHVQTDVGHAIKIYEKYWELLKIEG